MKNDKSMMKRMAAEYRNREDYSRLLEKYFRLQRENESMRKEAEGLRLRYEHSQEVCFKLFVVCAVLFAMLSFAAVLVAYFATKGAA